MKRSYFIAEIGVNHEGSIERAKEMVLSAKDAGADCVKFQTYKAEKLASRNSPAYWDTNSEPTLTQFELFKKLDSFNISDYEMLHRLCEEVGIEFMTTPFDLSAVEEMDPLLKRYKIASADITNKPLLEAIGSKNKPVIVSTGASTKLEIQQAIDILEQSGCSEISLLHCVLNYPTPLSGAHMAMMCDLRESFPNYTLGYSDHTLPNSPFIALFQSLLVGGEIIEKHYTFNKQLAGNDHYHAFDCEDLKKFRQMEKAHLDCWGGIEEKQPTPNEDTAIRNARRSICLAHAVKKGQVLHADDLIMKRPGFGISPMNICQVIGKVAVMDLPEDTIVEMRMFV